MCSVSILGGHGYTDKHALLIYIEVYETRIEQKEARQNIVFSFSPNEWLQGFYFPITHISSRDDCDLIAAADAAAEVPVKDPTPTACANLQLANQCGDIRLRCRG